MKKKLLRLSLLVLALGCAGNEPTEMEFRLDAALQLEEGADRHNALKACAENAAKAGEFNVICKAISQVSKNATRENLRATCSEILANAGNVANAKQLAMQIESESRRSNVLSKIAAGQVKN